MAWISDEVLDAALNEIANTAENLYICSQEPTTFTQASATYALGSKAGPTFTGPADGDVSGRKLTVDAISDGSASADGTASHWALTDDSLSVLLVTGALDASKTVNNGDTFTTTAGDIEIPDPA